MDTHCNKETEIVKPILKFTNFKTDKQYFKLLWEACCCLDVCMYTLVIMAYLCIMITVFIQLLHSLLYTLHIKDINCIQLALISIRPKIIMFPL